MKLNVDKARARVLGGLLRLGKTLFSKLKGKIPGGKKLPGGNPSGANGPWTIPYGQNAVLAPGKKSLLREIGVGMAIQAPMAAVFGLPLLMDTSGQAAPEPGQQQQQSAQPTYQQYQQLHQSAQPAYQQYQQLQQSAQPTNQQYQQLYQSAQPTDQQYLQLQQSAV